MIAAEVLLLRAHRSRRCRSTRASRCSSSTWTRPASTSGRCATSTAPPDFAEVFFTDVDRAAREPRRRAERRLGASRRARSRTSAPACGSRASAGSSRPSTGSSSSRSSTGRDRRPGRAPQDRRRSTSSRRACARSATRASRRSRRARRRPSTRYMKMATSEPGKAAVRARHGDLQGPFGAVTDAERRPGRRPLGRTASS